MLRHAYLLLNCLICLMACDDDTAVAETPDNTDITTFVEMLDTYHEERLWYYPFEATFAGDPRYNDRLPNDLTAAFRDSLRQFYQKYQDALLAYPIEDLTPTEQVSHQVLAWECAINLAELAFPTHLLPIDQFESLHLTIGQLAGGSSAQPFVTVEDYENWLSRLDAFVVWCDTAVVNMRLGVQQGYVLPKALIEKTIPQFTDLAAGPVEKHLFYTPIDSLPVEFAETEKTRLTEVYTSMIGERIIPTMQRVADFLRNEYLPAGRTTAGIADVPNGRAYYQHQIEKFTTTDATADEIFELGQQEVARISAEMEQVKAQVDFDGDLKAFFEHVRTRQELMPFDDPAEVIARFEEIHQRMQPNLERLFDLTPKTAFEVRRTEAFREASASAEYMPGSTDGSRPGVFYVPIPDVQAYNILSDEDLFLHEAIPGHHYQISLQQENEDLPAFRRTLWYSAYGEGWALYSESLGRELGLYEDPYQYFGMLSAEMHRAIRLVVDAGMHTKGWTREQAIQYSLDHEAEPEASIIAEIERYMSWPGQALSYKVGQLKIQELRQRAAEAMGEAFDVRAFHNRVLEPGCVPLAVLETQIDNWIAE